MIAADLAGKPRPAFRYFDKGDMATIGRMAAVANVEVALQGAHERLSRLVHLAHGAHLLSHRLPQPALRALPTGSGPTSPSRAARASSPATRPCPAGTEQIQGPKPRTERHTDLEPRAHRCRLDRRARFRASVSEIGAALKGFDPSHADLPPFDPIPLSKLRKKCSILRFVRTNLELVEEKLRARGADPAALLGDFRALDKSRREAITTCRTAESPPQRALAAGGRLKKAGKNDEAAAVMEETRALKDKLDELDKTAAALDEQLRLSLARVPNLTRDEVPVGTSEADNITVKTWGEQKKFDFTPKPHWEIGEALGILDLERAAKLSGARFAVYMGAGARLERALISFMLDLHTRSTATPKCCRRSWSTPSRSSAPASFPSLPRICSAAPTLMPKPPRAANSKTTTTGSFPPPKFPSPISIATRFSTTRACPSRFTAYTPCFRAEAGAAGKDTRGIIRQHQFQKVELVKFTRPEESDARARAADARRRRDS